MNALLKCYRVMVVPTLLNGCRGKNFPFSDRIYIERRDE